MLLDHFYTIRSCESADSTTWTIRLELNPQHPVYQGHFPNHPVVPGVCMLQFIKECTEEIRQRKLRYAQIASCKFLSALQPSETPLVSLTLSFKATEEGNQIQLQAEGTTKNECFIKLKAVLIPHD